MSAFTNVQQVIQTFITEHPEELVNGKLKICIAGGAGFIGSHIAKCLKAEVGYHLFHIVEYFRRDWWSDCVGMMMMIIGMLCSVC